MRHPVSALLLATIVIANAQLAAQTPDRVMGAQYHNPSRAYVDLMIPHHEMALMMAEQHQPMLKSDSAKAFVRRMIAMQRQEIAALKDARRALFGSDSARPPAMQHMMQMMMGMHGRDSAATHPMPDTARRMHGPPPVQPRPMPDTTHRMHQAPPSGQPRPMMSMMSGDMDRMFLEHMIRHHQDGADLSVLAEDSQAAARVKQLAKKIREGQERDIAAMRRLLAALPRPSGQGH